MRNEECVYIRTNLYVHTHIRAYIHIVLFSHDMTDLTHTQRHTQTVKHKHKQPDTPVAQTDTNSNTNTHKYKQPCTYNHTKKRNFLSTAPTALKTQRRPVVKYMSKIVLELARQGMPALNTSNDLSMLA